jgi:hypothetical protein
VMSRLSTSKALRPRVVFSGIQPTGVPHLGNYVGALRQWVQLQYEEPTTTLLYSIVDLHAITTFQSPEILKNRKRETLAALLAIGIKPERCTLFHQSAVSYTICIASEADKSSRRFCLTVFSSRVLTSFRYQHIQNSCGFYLALLQSDIYQG